MQELCLHLSLKDMELKRKIWTCFEHTIIHHTDLMQDRHLDQILMCSVYIICKVNISISCINDADIYVDQTATLISLSLVGAWFIC